MLLELSISNLVIVERARLEPGGGLTVITGETGAGKSLLLDALDLILGGRGGSTLVGPQGDAAVVVAAFEVVPELRMRLAAAVGLDLDDSEPVILRRRVHRAGRSQAWINDVPVGVRALRCAGELLVERRSQHEHMRLGQPEVQMGLLDRYGGHRELARDYGESYRRLRDLSGRLRELVEGGEESVRERDFIRFQLDEIEAVDPQSGEYAAASQRQALLASAQEWQALAGHAAQALAEDDSSAMMIAGGFARRLAEAPDEGLRRAAEACLEAQEALQEAARLAGAAAERIEAAPAALAEVEERLTAIDSLVRKHGGSEDSLHRRWGELSARYAELDHIEERQVDLSRAVAAETERCHELGQRLATARRQAGVALAKTVAAELDDLGMPKAKLRLHEEPLDEPSALGVVAQRFHVCTNPGLPFGPLDQVPSGGEASRLTLALAVALAASDEIPVMVFDEIDAGVGGRLGAAIAAKLVALARGRTVISVSHTPQIAAVAGVHYRVCKRQGENRTDVLVERVDDSGRMEEIAEMLGGGGAALHQARALLRVGIDDSG